MTETPTLGEALIRVPEAARRLAISRAQAYKLANRGELPGAVRVGGALRVDPRVLVDWLESQAIRPR